MSGSIVIVGAGIAGVAAAYHLAVRHGCRDVKLVEAENPLSMTSDKSTEAYRNWWPGPDGAMTAYMNRSIDLLEELARGSGNRFNMNRRGYLFASADATRAPWLIEMAELAARHGGGAARVHGSAATSAYSPAPDAAFDAPLAGADILTDPALIRRHFPYLNGNTKVVAHVRRAGWLSAQQLGMMMLEAAREAGVRLVRGRATRVETRGDRVSGVRVALAAGGEELLAADSAVLASGPLVKEMASLAGLTLPTFAEPHYKISWKDSERVVPRDAPMMIWLDPQQLPWHAEEREALAADATTRWLTEPFPGGAHGRPDGSGSTGTVLALYNYKNEQAEVVFPLPESEHYGEITLRGMTTMVPGLQVYLDRGARPYVDGGYYMKTPDNRPLIGPTPVAGLHLSCCYSGFGIMASQAGADLLTAHLLDKPLPSHADAFALARFSDPVHLARIATWGDGGQL
ncbi:MAG: FAD-binding oxidoreductase [Alphaproteobacteria bacterium]|nr:FAD-binding oxidoreductase [Alphaproteobacteria bacterium]